MKDASEKMVTIADYPLLFSFIVLYLPMRECKLDFFMFAFQSNFTGLQTVYQNGRKSDQEFANGDMNFQKCSERQTDRTPGTSAEA